MQNRGEREKTNKERRLGFRALERVFGNFILLYFYFLGLYSQGSVLENLGREEGPVPNAEPSDQEITTGVRLDGQNFRGRSSADPGHTATHRSLSLAHTKTTDPTTDPTTDHLGLSHSTLTCGLGYAPRSSHGAKDLGSAVFRFEIEG